MSKPQPPIALNPVPLPAPPKSLSKIPAVIQVLTAISLFWVVMTPIAYINGRAFHDGWYGALNLDQAMFPLDTQGTLAQAAVAWVDCLSLAIVALGGAFKARWLQLGSLIVVNSLLITGMVAGLSAWERRRSRINSKSAKKEKSLFRRGVSLILTPLAVLGVSTAAIYVAIFCLTLVMAALILPFSQVGKYEAKLEITKNFSDMPMVTVKSPKGDVQQREIAAGPQFLGLWSDGRAAFAPVSAITWGEASPPGK